MAEDDADAEQAERREHEGHQQHDDRTHHPQHLGKVRVAAALVVRRLLGDQRPRRGHIGAHREPGDHVAGDEHPRLLREDDEQQPEGVDQQVPLVDALAAVAVAQPAADQRADTRRDRVGADAPMSPTKSELRWNSSVHSVSPAAPATIEPASM
jgi:hypothetical protein